MLTYDRNVKKLTKLGYIYNIAASTEKQELCRHIFSTDLYISNHIVRTAENSLTQQLKTKAINGLDIIKKEHIQQLYGCIPESTPFRTQYEPTIHSLLSLLGKITA